MADKKGFGGNYSGRSDYKSGRPAKATESVTTNGDKGIPSGLSAPGNKQTTKSVETVTTAGDKGIPPMGVNPSHPIDTARKD